MSELNLFGALDGKAKQDVEALWHPITEQKFPWPKGMILKKISLLIDAYGRGVFAVFQDETSDVPLLEHSLSEPRVEDLVFLRVTWDFRVDPNGLLTATPCPFDHWTPTPNMRTRAMELVAAMGIKTIIRQLPEKLFPFLPNVATRGMEKMDARRTNTDTRLWGYASDVRAFRAALMDELHKPL
jgi:hypothetical protein